MSAGRDRSDGFNAIRNPDNFSYNPDRDGYRSSNASGTLGMNYRGSDELVLQFFANRLNAQFDAGPDFDDRSRVQLESYAISTRNRIIEPWESLLRVGRSVDDSRFESAFGTSRFRSSQNQYLWQNDLSLGRNRVQLGAERREERLASDIAYDATGNRSVQTSFVVSTSACTDTQPPATPTGT